MKRTRITKCMLAVLLICFSAETAGATYSNEDINDAKIKFIATVTHQYKLDIYTDILEGATSIECVLKTEKSYIQFQKSACVRKESIGVDRLIDVSQGTWQRIGECEYSLRVDFEDKSQKYKERHVSGIYAKLFSVDGKMFVGQFEEMYLKERYGSIVAIKMD